MGAAVHNDPVLQPLEINQVDLGNAERRERKSKEAAAASAEQRKKMRDAVQTMLDNQASVKPEQ
jgi:hypothetical protein